MRNWFRSFFKNPDEFVSSKQFNRMEVVNDYK